MAIPNLFWAYVGSILHSITEWDADGDHRGDIEKLIFMSFGFIIALIGIYQVSLRAKEQIKL